MANRYIDKYYDQAFLLELSKSIIDDSGNGIKIKEVLDKHNIDISHDRAIVEKSTKVGPNFDLRYAGAAYKLESNPAGITELLVHCVDRTVLVDGVEVDALKNTNGHITFTTQRKYAFDITFDVVVGEGITVPLSEWSFSGRIHLANKSWPVKGTRYFPWEELVSDALDDRKTSHAEEARDACALKCFPVALDLVRNPSSIQVLDDTWADKSHDEHVHDVVFVDGPSSDHQNVPDRHKKKSVFRKSAMVEHVVNLTPGMICLATTAGVAAALGGPAGLVGSFATLLVGYAGNTIVSKVRKGSQKKLSKELKNSNGLLSEAEMKSMSMKAVEQVIYGEEEGEKLTKEVVKIKAKEKFKDEAKDTIWAKNYQRMATQYDNLYSFGKSTFREGLNKGSDDWISKNVSESKLEHMLDTAVDAVKSGIAPSSTTTRRKAELKLETEKLGKQRTEKLKQIRDVIKFQPTKAQDQTKKRMNDLDKEFQKDMKEIETLTKQDTPEALDRAAAAEKRLHEKMEKLEQLHKDHLGVRERGHGHST